MSCKGLLAASEKENNREFKDVVFEDVAFDNNSKTC